MQDLFIRFVIQFVQVCRNWRYTLFHPSFWKKITFVFRDEDSVLWTRFVESYLLFIYINLLKVAQYMIYFVIELWQIISL